MIPGTLHGMLAAAVGSKAFFNTPVTHCVMLQPALCRFHTHCVMLLPALCRTHTHCHAAASIVQ